MCMTWSVIYSASLDEVMVKKLAIHTTFLIPICLFNDVVHLTVRQDMHNCQCNCNFLVIIRSVGVGNSGAQLCYCAHFLHRIWVLLHCNKKQQLLYEQNAGLKRPEITIMKGLKEGSWQKVPWPLKALYKLPVCIHPFTFLNWWQWQSQRVPPDNQPYTFTRWRCSSTNQMLSETSGLSPQRQPPQIAKKIAYHDDVILLV